MNPANNPTDQARSDLQLYPAKAAPKLVMAQKTLAIRVKLERYENFCIWLLWLLALFYVSGIGGQVAGTISFVMCLCTGLVAWSFDHIRRSILRLT